LGQLGGGSKSWSPPCIPSCRHGGPGAIEEGAVEEAKKRLNHTFASSSRLSASHLLEVLIIGLLDVNLQEEVVM
jgi:hypothetical protein